MISLNACLSSYMNSLSAAVEEAEIARNLALEEMYTARGKTVTAAVKLGAHDGQKNALEGVIPIIAEMTEKIRALESRADTAECLNDALLADLSFIHDIAKTANKGERRETLRAIADLTFDVG